MSPSVSVSCITKKQDSVSLARIFLDEGFSKAGPYQGALGYTISAHAIKGRSSSGKRFVNLNDLSDIMSKNKDFGENVIHFIPDFKNLCEIPNQIQKIFNTKSIYERGLSQKVQINRIIPEFSTLKKIKSSFPDLSIWCQFDIGKMSISDDLSQSLKQKMLDRVLLDSSFGEGKSFDLQAITLFLRDFVGLYPHIDIGIAGGLNPENIQQNLSSILDAIPKPVSIDAETGLRNLETDELDLNKCRTYIHRSAIALKLK